jgi:hypothetical protein
MALVAPASLPPTRMNTFRTRSNMLRLGISKAAGRALWGSFNDLVGTRDKRQW